MSLYVNRQVIRYSCLSMDAKFMGLGEDVIWKRFLYYCKIIEKASNNIFDDHITEY